MKADRLRNLQAVVAGGNSDEARVMEDCEYACEIVMVAVATLDGALESGVGGSNLKRVD